MNWDQKCFFKSVKWIHTKKTWKEEVTNQGEEQKAKEMGH